MREHDPGISTPNNTTAPRDEPLQFRVLAGVDYRVLISSRGISVNPWAGDPIEDRDGIFLYVRDLESLRFWSVGLRPTLARPDRYEVCSSPGCFTVRREDDGIDLAMDLCVDPVSPMEIRRVRITNGTSRVRRLELTSYTEIALSSRESFRAHPAFSKLFLETAFDPEHSVILVRRRKRGEDESHPVLFHALLEGSPVEVETNRARFLGRGRDARNPAALHATVPLSGTTGFVLDASASLRRFLELAPGATTTATFLWGLADAGAPFSVAAALDRLRGGDLAEHAFDLAAHVEKRRRVEVGIDGPAAESLQDLAGASLYGLLGIRSSSRPQETEAGPEGGAPVRSPLLAVVRADLPGAAGWTEDALRAHRYWRALGLPVETVVVHSGTADPARGGEESGLRWIPRGFLGDGELDACISSAHVVIDRPLPEIAAEVRRM
jgi:cyclic beta-1,2-glucan synthetase